MSASLTSDISYLNSGRSHKKNLKKYILRGGGQVWKFSKKSFFLALKSKCLLICCVRAYDAKERKIRAESHGSVVYFLFC